MEAAAAQLDVRQTEDAPVLRTAVALASLVIIAAACRRQSYTVADAFFCPGLGPGALDATLVGSEQRSDVPWASLVVQVRAAEEPGQPLAGATVDLFRVPRGPRQEPVRLGTSDSLGYVAMDSLAPGVYDLRVRSIRYRPVRGSVTARLGLRDTLLVRQPIDLVC